MQQVRCREHGFTPSGLPGKAFTTAYGQTWKITHRILTRSQTAHTVIRASWQYPWWHQRFSAFQMRHAFQKNIFKKNDNTKCWWEYIAIGTHTLLAGIKMFTILENFVTIHSLNVGWKRAHLITKHLLVCHRTACTCASKDRQSMAALFRTAQNKTKSPDVYNSGMHKL